MNKTNFSAEIISLEPALMRYAYSLTLDTDETKDLVQETYYKALPKSEHAHPLEAVQSTHI